MITDLKHPKVVDKYCHGLFKKQTKKKLRYYVNQRERKIIHSKVDIINYIYKLRVYI